MKKLLSWIHRNCRFAQAQVGTDVSEYAASLKRRVEELMAYRKTRIDRLRALNLSPESVLQQLAQCGYPDMQEASQALASKDSSVVSDLTWAFNEFLRTMSKDKTISYERKNAGHKAFSTLRDFEAKLDLEENPEEAEEAIRPEEYANLISQTQANMQGLAQQVSEAIARLGPQWGGSPVVVSAFPLDKESEFLAGDACEVRLGDVENGPSFMLFFEGGKPMIDDIIEGGDEDFFSEPGIQGDYFNLISAIQNPQGRKKKRMPALYTARPVADREMYRSTTQLPANIFLTNQLNHAAGLANDLGASETRDVWEVYLNDDTGLVRTLNPADLSDSPYRLQYYQTTRQVPIKSMHLVQEGKASSVKPNVPQKPEISS